MKRNQSGFTLIEIAIVLVIIGLLLGGVMKGQELINSAKVKNLATDFKNIPVYVYGYQDKYRALPGDDPAVDSHLGASAAQAVSGTAGASPGNGRIDGDWDAGAASANADAETNLFWQHVRMAGLAPGPIDAANDLRPANAAGGYVGITNVDDAPIGGMRGSFIVCSGGIAGKFAKQLDITMDDSNTATGSMQTQKTGATTAEASPADDTTYIVCMGY